MPRRSELRLTKRTVDSLVVNGNDTVFWDRDLAGFGVRVHSTGRKLYVVQSRGPTGPKRVTLGRHGELATDKARKQAAVVIDRIKRGEKTVPPPAELEFTVAALAERYMRAHVEVHCKPSTMETYRFLIERNILPALGQDVISAVGRLEITALHHQIRGTPITANAAVDILSKTFSLAEAWDQIPPERNPCRAVRRYKRRTRERFLSPNEFRTLGRVLREAKADCPPDEARQLLATNPGKGRARGRANPRLESQLRLKGIGARRKPADDWKIARPRAGRDHGPIRSLGSRFRLRIRGTNRTQSCFRYLGRRNEVPFSITPMYPVSFVSLRIYF